MILVNNNDIEVGYADKMTTHHNGLLHRAFSVILYCQYKGEKMTLLQQRALSKYHGGGLWSNACCSHFLPGIDMIQTVKNRLEHELGISTEVSFLRKFKYKAQLGEMVENEIDYIFEGEIPYIKPKFNYNEVQDITWISCEELQKISLDLEIFTPWAHLVYKG